MRVTVLTMAMIAICGLQLPTAVCLADDLPQPTSVTAPAHNGTEYVHQIGYVTLSSTHDGTSSGYAANEAITITYNTSLRWTFGQGPNAAGPYQPVGCYEDKVSSSEICDNEGKFKMPHKTYFTSIQVAPFDYAALAYTFIGNLGFTDYCNFRVLNQ